MRVITGSARGAKLGTLEGMDLRPTADRVKEAIFSSIQFEIEGRRVLDLFAGSGQLGIEALSRGAQSAAFIDSNSEAVRMIKQNLTHVRLLQKATVLESDCNMFLAHCKNQYDVVLMDPPYRRGLAENALPLAAKVTAPGGLIVCETAKADPMPETAGNFTLFQKKDYGKTSVRIYRIKDVE